MMHHMINEIAYLSFSKHKIALKSYAYKTWVHIFTFLLKAIKFCLSYVYQAPTDCLKPLLYFSLNDCSSGLAT